MNNLHPQAVDSSAFFGSANGGLGLALGMVAIYCRDLTPEYGKTVLLSLGTGCIIVSLVLFLGKARGFGEELPIPPMFIFTLITILAYYTALP